MLLSRASKEIQLADHLLTVLYPISQDPRVLLTVLKHACQGVYATQEAMLGVAVPGAEEAYDVCERFREILDRHEHAHTEFTRNQTLVIADSSFLVLEQLTLADVVRGMTILKGYVYQATRAVVLHGTVE